MAILLLILKIIGMTLLIILGLVVFLVLMLLFYPVGYRVQGSWEDELKVKFTVGWLFRLVYARVIYEKGETGVILRIFGIPFMRILKPEERKKHRKPKQTKKTVTPEKKVLIEEPSIEYNMHERQETFQKDETESDVEPKEHFSDKLRRIRTKILNIPKQVRSILTTIKTWKDKAGSIKELVFAEGNKKALSVVWAELMELLRHYRPRKIRANLTYCMGDPAKTGQVLAGLSVLLFLYSYQVSIVPDFESESFYVKGTWDVKGRIRLFVLLKAAIHIYREKEVRRFIGQLREREDI